MHFASHLPKPNTQIQQQLQIFSTGEIAVASIMQGWRKGLEDRAICTRLTPHLIYAAIYDGHGGPEVAEYLLRTFHKEIKNEPFFHLGNYGRALTNTFKRIDEMLLSQRGESDIRAIQKELKVPVSPVGKIACLEVGTTAHVLLISETKVYSASIGDSRGIICRNGVAEALSHDHKPDNSYEKSRITKAGGVVKNGRINGGLNLSRCFGDFSLKLNPKKPYNEQIVTAIPEINQFERCKEDEYIFMASDGVWERYKSNNQRFVEEFNLLRAKHENNEDEYAGLMESLFVGKILGASIESVNGLDNMSAVYIKMNP